MPEITVNTSDLELRRARESLLSGFAGALDAKRPMAWAQYGYPQEVTFERLRAAYERGGAGHGAVHRILDKCWQKFPRIKEPKADKPTAFEETINEVLDDIEGWQKLMEADRRNMVGHYAALIYRVADGKQLREPLVKATKLVDIVPLFEDQIYVTQWHSDQADAENFGKPKMFQYRMRQPTGPMNTQGKPDEMVDVHPSRVQILAEGSVGNMFEGAPLLRPGFNQLVDLEKISGGSAESFLKNSARAVTINFDKDASPAVLTQNADGTPNGKTVKQVLSEQVDNLNRNLDAALVTQGATADTLQTVVSDPQPSFEVAANLFAASVQIPFTILFGQQTGRLASDEDQKDMVQRCSSRQTNFLTPVLKQFTKRMQKLGVFPEGKFEIEWPDLGAPTDEQRIDSALKLTQASKTAFEGGLTEPVFDANEIRKLAGYEERADDGMPSEADQAAAEQAQRDHELALTAARGGGGPKPAPGAKPKVVASR